MPGERTSQIPSRTERHGEPPGSERSGTGLLWSLWSGERPGRPGPRAGTPTPAMRTRSRSSAPRGSCRPAAGGFSKRRIAGESEHDLMGPYPLFACPNWAGLADDLNALRGRAVSVVVVADPLAPVTESDLRQAFRDRVAPLKPHQVRDLDRPPALPNHHRRRVRRAARAVEVEVCTDPGDASGGVDPSLRRPGRPPPGDGHRGVLTRRLSAPARVARPRGPARRARGPDGGHGAVVRGRSQRLLPPRGLRARGIRGERVLRAVRRRLRPASRARRAVGRPRRAGRGRVAG